MNLSTKWFLIVLFSVAAAIAIVYVVVREISSSLDGFYVVTDSFIDSTSSESASVWFLQVTDYDSSKIVRVADKLTGEVLSGGTADVHKLRTFLYHFYVPGDTASLSQEMVDELAYTHPSIINASETLMLIPGGFVIKATFPEAGVKPDSTDVRRTQFYMPRAGLRAKDFR